MAVDEKNNKKKRKPVGRQTGPKNGTGPAATDDPNKFSAIALAKKIKERKRRNQEALKGNF